MSGAYLQCKRMINAHWPHLEVVAYEYPIPAWRMNTSTVISTGVWTIMIILLIGVENVFVWFN